MRCLKCGKREQYADNLCEECLVNSIEPFHLPEVVTGYVCPSCNSISSNLKSWNECDGTLADAAIVTARNNLKVHEDVEIQSIDLSVDSYDKSVFHISGKGIGIYKGVITKQDLNTEVRLTKNLCEICSKKHGNYYEAILQIRGLSHLKNGEIEDLLENVMDRTYDAHARDSSVFVTKMEKVRGGYDFYLGDRTFAKNLAQDLHSSLGGEFKVSSSLWGRKDGQEVYRYTFLVRLPGFMEGDILMVDNVPHLVERINAKKVRTMNLQTGKKLRLHMNKAMEKPVIRGEDVKKDLVIIMDAGKEIQVLHPETLRPVDLIKPHDISLEGGDRLEGLLIEGEIYLI